MSSIRDEKSTAVIDFTFRARGMAIVPPPQAMSRTVQLSRGRMILTKASGYPVQAAYSEYSLARPFQNSRLSIGAASVRSLFSHPTFLYFTLTSIRYSFCNLSMGAPFEAGYLLRYISFEITISQSFKYVEPILLAEINRLSLPQDRTFLLKRRQACLPIFFLDEGL
ncbi:MAG: hypothetical protein A4E62_02115 [Syntrophorhabdus sp. PtaU1.Bin002]|nr:MAG: hypothetical protein A4E62_02115 [Syntrophorhabdus sp. PtaU1.Bin002]